jgi:hypothetical protein
LFSVELELCFVDVCGLACEEFAIGLCDLRDFIVSLENFGVATDCFFAMSIFEEQGLEGDFLPKASFMGYTMGFACLTRVCLGGGGVVEATDAHVDGV